LRCGGERAGKRARLVRGSGVARACWAGSARGRGLGGKETGRGFRLVGPSAGKGEGVGLGPVVGFLGRVSVGFGFVFYFPFSFLFLLQTKFEFKYKFEFKQHSNKNMHQHEMQHKN